MASTVVHQLPDGLLHCLQISATCVPGASRQAPFVHIAVDKSPSRGLKYINWSTFYFGAYPLDKVIRSLNDWRPDPIITLCVGEILFFYFIDASILLENTPLVKFIQNYIRDPSGVFSISSPVKILLTSFPAFSRLFLFLFCYFT